MQYDCLVVSPDGTRLWLVRDGNRWSLPHVDCEAGWLPNAVASLQSLFRARYAMDVAVLREILRTPASAVCEVETLRVAPGAANAGTWHDAANAAAALSDPEHRAAVVRWQEDGGVETHFAPWQRRGWHEHARVWIARSVQQAGLEVTGAVTQVKAGWNGSAVLKVPTSGGALYFKASSPRKPGEPAVLRALSVGWSRHLPHVIDAAEDRCWMLVREADGEILDGCDPPPSAEAARLFARIQVDQAADIDRWTGMGCPDHGLETIERHLPRVLEEIPERLRGVGVIDAAERDEMASFVPLARTLCRELAAFAVPHRSIHHEDFRSGNVLRGPNGNLVILDWNETVVAHPFFSIQRFLWFILPPDGARRHEILDTKSDAFRRAVRDAYLEPFARFEPRPRLLEAFRLSCLLAPIYDALRFQVNAYLDAIFARGLVPEERRIARELVDHILDVRRSAAQGMRPRRVWGWPWTKRSWPDENRRGRRLPDGALQGPPAAERER
jgi:hypothetical protein